MLRQQVALIFALVQMAATAVAGASLIHINTIFITWPALAMIGFVVCFVTWPSRSRATFAFGLSAPLVTALGAALIVGQDYVNGSWTATLHDVVEVLLFLLMLYGFFLLPMFVFSLVRILKWGCAPPAPRTTKWQFSLRTLLVIMTIVAIGVPILAGATRNVNDKIAVWVFGGYALSTVAACGVVIERFVAERRSL